MVRIKKSKFLWFGVIMLGVIILGMPAVYAEDELVPLDVVGDEANLDQENYDADNSDPEPVLGSTTQDFLFTPVKPCRIIDTRNAGGKIPSGGTRSFFVHGPSLTGQGGNPAGCIAPRDEPMAVLMNIVAVNSTAPGYLTVWPYNTTKPLAGVLNYSPYDKTDPISNAFTVKTTYKGGYDISVYAYKQTHVVADVMGYYYYGEPAKITTAWFNNNNNNSSGVSIGTSYTTVVSQTLTVPKSGKILLTGSTSVTSSNIVYGYCRFTENGTQIDRWYFGDDDVPYMHISRSYMKYVTSGSKTYAMQCYRYGGASAAATYSNIVIQFFGQ